jgi:flagellar assembly factor FliW
MMANAQGRPAEPTEVATPFGAFTVAPQDRVRFPSGIPGFEDCREFVLVSPGDLGSLSCLQSLEGPPASFLVVDPRRVLPHYRCLLGTTDLMRLGATADTVLLWLAIVSMDEAGQAYANLRAPIVINPERMLGYQVVPHNSLYPLRQPLSSE